MSTLQTVSTNLMIYGKILIMSAYMIASGNFISLKISAKRTHGTVTNAFSINKP